MEIPEGSSVRTIFEDERATKGILAFLRDTKVGCMVSIVPPEEEREVGEGDKGGSDPH